MSRTPPDNPLRALGLDPLHPPDAAAWPELFRRLEQAWAETEAIGVPSGEEGEPSCGRTCVSTRARLRAIARAVPDMLFFQDEAGTYLEVLTGSPEQLYLPPGEVVGKRPGDLFPPADAERFEGLLRAALESGGCRRLEYWLELPRGRRLFEARCVPVDYRVNGLRTLLTVVHDITDQRREETWNRLVGQAVSAAREGILILDEARRVLFSNPAWARLEADDPSRLPECIACNDALWAAVERDGTCRTELRLPGDGERWWWVRVEQVRLDSDGCRYHVVLVDDVTELHASRRKLEHLATHDALTGLPNRVLFRDRLEQALARARREGRGGGLLFIDLDRFKGVNDTLGHAAGDRLLAEAAQRLAALVRDTDTLARLGGDEFILLVEGVEERAFLEEIGGKLQSAFDRPFLIRGRPCRISASIGIGLFPRDGEQADQLLQRADAAMYAAKSGGGGCSRFYSPALGERSGESFELEQSLRQALATDALHLAFQPQFRVSDGRLAGMEVLLRWHSPRWGEVGPARFIPVAESSGFMDALGRWVLDSACRQYARWRAAGLEVPRLAVNLSACELRQPGLARRVEETLARHRMPAAALECEITESMILDDETGCHANLLALHELGVGLAIDDFGTGHSTLLNLKRFPLDCLKIDASFVRDVGRDRNDEAIIRASVALARSFGMRTVAEGVEEPGQHGFLRRCGCDEMQGFLCGRPVPADRAAACLSGGACPPDL